MILSEGLIRTLHIVLPHLLIDVNHNPSLTHLHYLRTPLSKLITGLIGIGSLPLPHQDLLHLLKKSERNLLERKATSGVGN